MEKLDQVDLFENHNLLPPEVLAIYDEFPDKLTYEECACFLQRMEAVGYSFEYYLDALPFNLKKYTNKNNIKTKMNKIRSFTDSLGKAPDNLLPIKKNNLELNLNRDSKGFNLHLFDGSSYLFSITAVDRESIQSYLSINNLTIKNDYENKMFK